jgi:hypothetical protein
MTGAILAQLIITLGPTALELAPKLAEVWTKELSNDEVQSICGSSRKSYEAYIAEAQARRAALLGTEPVGLPPFAPPDPSVGFTSEPIVFPPTTSFTAPPNPSP